MIEVLDKYVGYGRTRKYNKVTKANRIASRENYKPPTIFTNEYQNLSWQNRIKKAASIASDNGRCWWVYDYIMRTTIRKKD